jgi:hypothetical protein
MNKFLPFVLALACTMFSCNVRVKRPHQAVFATVERLMRGDTTKTGFFTNTLLFDAKYNEILYKTTKGNVVVENDGTQNFFACRYDPETYAPIWIAVGGGTGGDGGCNYYTVPPENAVYVVGYFEGTAYFPIKAGSRKYKEIISNGMVDMFVAKYNYDNGELLWIASGGSVNADVVFLDNVGARHKETLITVDSSVVTVYTNFFGTAKFGDKSIDAKISGSAVQISYDKATGEVKNVGFVTTLPQVQSK